MLVKGINDYDFVPPDLIRQQADKLARVRDVSCRTEVCNLIDDASARRQVCCSLDPDGSWDGQMRCPVSSPATVGVLAFAAGGGAGGAFYYDERDDARGEFRRTIRDAAAFYNRTGYHNEREKAEAEFIKTMEDAGKREFGSFVDNTSTEDEMVTRYGW